MTREEYAARELAKQAALGPIGRHDEAMWHLFVLGKTNHFCISEDS